VEGWAALPVEGSSGTVSDESETFTAVYDAWNRLVKLVDPATDDVVQENVYDARGYRVIRKSYAAGVLTETRHYYYTNGWRCVEERLGTSPDSAPAERQHVWGVRYIDDLICRDRQASLSSSSSSSSSGGRRLAERLYACQDGNWNVMAVVGTDGAVAERYEYDPYGQLTVRTPNFSPRGASSYDWNINYAGYRLDAETGLYQVRFRFLHPRFMWVTRDPIGYAAGMHLTQFVYSNPESFIDPMGLDPFNLNPAWDHHPDTPSLPPKPGDWISGGQWTFEDTVLSDMSYWGESRGSDGTWANAGLWAHYTLTTTARLKGTVLCGDSCGTTRKVNIDIQIMLVLDITQKLDNNVTARLKFILPWKWKSIVYMASAIQASLNYQRLQQLAEKSSGITSKGACLLAKAGVTDVTSSTIIRARMVIGDIAPNPDEKGPERWIPGPVLLPEFTPNPK
jgi:RHS repeat-associated protein